MHNIIDLIEKNCKPYLDALQSCNKGNFLLRGANPSIPDFKKWESRLNDRKPLNTPTETHDLVNELFLNKFGWNIRNGVFCYGWDFVKMGEPYDLGYGQQHLIFPIQEFEFVYNADHFDFFRFVIENPIDSEILKQQNFKNESLCEALNLGSNEHEFSHEISLKVESYYMVNLKYKEELINLIWSKW